MRTILLLLIASTVAGPGRAADVRGYRQPVRTGSPVVRVTNRLAQCADIGTGVVVHDDGRRAVILSCWHTFRDGTGKVTVCAGGQCYQAKVLKLDEQAELSALEVASIGLPAVRLGDAPPGGDRVTGWGLGSTGQLRRINGVVVGYLCNQEQHLVVSGAAHSGDSGGPILDAAGALVGIIWGNAEGKTYATRAQRIRDFLRDLLPSAPAQWRPSILPGPGPAMPKPPTGSGTGSQSAPKQLAPAEPAAPPGSSRPSPPKLLAPLAPAVAAAPPTGSGTGSQPAPAPGSAAGDESDVLGTAAQLTATAAPYVLAALGLSVPPAGAIGLGVWGLRILARRRRRRKSRPPQQPVADLAGGSGCDGSEPDAGLTLPSLPVDYAKVWADHYAHDGGNVHHEAIKSDLYREAVELLRNGSIAPQANGRSIADSLDDWVYQKFFERVPKAPQPDEQDENVYHRALMGFLYREAVNRLRGGEIQVLGYRETADEIDRWVRREFFKRTTKQGV